MSNKYINLQIEIFETLDLLMDVLEAADKSAYIKKLKSKLNDEEWQQARYEMYILLSLYHKGSQKIFPSPFDFDYFQDSQIKETLNTIPLEWIKELQINEDVMTLMHHLPTNTGSSVLKVWTYFIYGFYDRCIFNIDNGIQLQTLLNNKVEKERKVLIYIYYPKLIYLRGASEELLEQPDKALQWYLKIFSLTHFDYNNFIFGKGSQDVIYRIILFTLKRWYTLKPNQFNLESLNLEISMKDLPVYSSWNFEQCNFILWQSLKVYFSHIIDNHRYTSAQHILILKYTITLLVELDLQMDQPLIPILQIFKNVSNHKDLLDYLFSKYLSTISQLTPFPIAPTKVQYKDGNEDYSTIILSNKRVHDFCNLYMYRVLNTESSKEQFILILKECLNISFHSLKILRYLSAAYSSLGQYEQAVSYIYTYTHLAQERFINKVDGDQDDTIDEYISVLVLASRLLLIELDKGEESIVMASKAINLMTKDGILKSRALQLMGIAHMGISDSSLLDYDKAIECLTQAQILDSNNWMISYQISLLYLKSFNLENALKFARKAVQQNKYHVPSWHILTLLLTSNKDYEAALKICRIGFTNCVNYYFPKHFKSEERNIMDFMSEYIKPQQSTRNIVNNKDSLEDIDQVAAQLINLKITETMITEFLEGPKKGLKVCKEVLKYYKLWNDESISDVPSQSEISEKERSASVTDEIDELPSLQKSQSRTSIHSSVSNSSVIPKPIFTHISDTDVMKNKKLKFAIETAISRARTVSRRAKNLKNLRPNKKEKKKTSTTTISNISKGKKSQRQQHVLIAIWSRIVKLLINSNQIVDARESVMELQAIDPLNVDVWIGEALVLMAEGKHAEAISILESISMDNQPMELLLTLAQCYFQINSFNMAEHVLHTITNHYDCQFTCEPWYK
eukprot:NODE_32_length_37098_cov_1.132760.p4 type:complete len:909 gc:universal NODE_32_length_37098_cov_1.132760:22278-25004(+)